MNTKKLEAVRSEIAAVAAQSNTREATLRSRAEVRSALKALVQSMHDKAAERVAADLERLAAGIDANLLGSDAHENGQINWGLSQLSTDFTATLVLAVGQKEIMARLEPLLEQAVPEGLSPAARQRQQSELGKKLETLELEEDRLCRLIDADGGTWDPRPGQRARLAIAMHDEGHK